MVTQSSTHRLCNYCLSGWCAKFSVHVVEPLVLRLEGCGREGLARQEGIQSLMYMLPLVYLVP